METRSKFSSVAWGGVLLLCTSLACMEKGQETPPKAVPFHIVETAGLERDSVNVEPTSGSLAAPVDVRLTASNLTPEVNELVTLKVEYSPHKDAPNSRVRIAYIPRWVEIVTGDTLWKGDVKKGETVVGEVVIRSTRKQVFSVSARCGFPKHGINESMLKFFVKGAVEVPQRFLSLQASIEKLQSHLADIKSGRLLKEKAREIYRMPRIALAKTDQQQGSAASMSQEDSIYQALLDETEKLTGQIYGLLYPPKGMGIRLDPLNTKDSTRSKKN